MVAATISRILDNEKYAGRWIWNRTESRRDPKTGRRRRFDKPESEWVINDDEEHADRAEAAKGRSPEAPEGDAPDLARRERQSRILEGTGQPAGSLPHPPARRQHGLWIVRRDHRAGERQEGRLLRLPGRQQGRMQKQDARPSDSRREGQSSEPSRGR
jgi:hypothetical protein